MTHKRVHSGQQLLVELEEGNAKNERRQQSAAVMAAASDENRLVQ